MRKRMEPSLFVAILYYSLRRLQNQLIHHTLQIPHAIRNEIAASWLYNTKLLHKQSWSHCLLATLLKFPPSAATVKATTDGLELLRLKTTARCASRGNISANTAIQGNVCMVCCLSKQGKPRSGDVEH